jgi:8-oxo-dGTP pyrophosphatase MutT (NUDIX family)
MTDEAIPAATLIVVRDRGAGAPELLMVERSEGMAFAAGALVFPGGRIDEADGQLGTDPAIVAAIRETIEETAIPVGLTPLPSADACAEIQAALAAGDDFGQILNVARLTIDAGSLTAFARWVPKFHAVRRFDTMFFVTRCPPGMWTPQVIEGECAGACWITASDALAHPRLIFPTRRNLERLAQFASYEKVRADALARPIEPVTPWVEERDGLKYITIPDHLGYPVTAERLDGLWRG